MKCLENWVLPYFLEKKREGLSGFIDKQITNAATRLV